MLFVLSYRCREVIIIGHNKRVKNCCKGYNINRSTTHDVIGKDRLQLLVIKQHSRWRVLRSKLLHFREANLFIIKWNDLAYCVNQLSWSHGQRPWRRRRWRSFYLDALETTRTTNEISTPTRDSNRSRQVPNLVILPPILPAARTPGPTMACTFLPSCWFPSGMIEDHFPERIKGYDEYRWRQCDQMKK